MCLDISNRVCLDARSKRADRCCQQRILHATKHFVLHTLTATNYLKPTIHKNTTQPQQQKQFNAHENDSNHAVLCASKLWQKPSRTHTHIFFRYCLKNQKYIATVKLITLFFMWKYYHFQHDQMYYFEYMYEIAIQKPKTPLIRTNMQIADVMKCIFASNEAKSNKINYLEPKMPTICTNCI